jgi:AraC-like DNA-binding protein
MEEWMSSLPAAAARTLSLFAPPYEHTVPCTPDVIRELVDVDDWKGCALVWQLNGEPQQMEEYDALRHRAPGFPLLVLLPPPSDIHKAIAMLPLVRVLAPRMILPHGLIDTPYRLRQVLSMPPRGLATAVTEYLVRRGTLTKRPLVREMQRIFELAADTNSIATLARRMYTSRRTLGRHFSAQGLPVPSHCLHFARIAHVAVQLQNDDAAIFRVAARYGYPDGFTLSNQMKRLTGHRPSEVRELLGWEWIVESWLKKERIR